MGLHIKKSVPIFMKMFSGGKKKMDMLMSYNALRTDWAQNSAIESQGF